MRGEEQDGGRASHCWDRHVCSGDGDLDDLYENLPLRG